MLLTNYGGSYIEFTHKRSSWWFPDKHAGLRRHGTDQGLPRTTPMYQSYGDGRGDEGKWSAPGALLSNANGESVLIYSLIKCY